jgi:hypothetical protein
MSEPDDSFHDVLDLAVLVGVWRMPRACTVGETSSRSTSSAKFPIGPAPFSSLELFFLPSSWSSFGKLDEAWRGYSEWSMPEDTRDR